MEIKHTIIPENMNTSKGHRLNAVTGKWEIDDDYINDLVQAKLDTVLPTLALKTDITPHPDIPTQAELDERYVKKTGDVMTGNLEMRNKRVIFANASGSEKNGSVGFTGEHFTVIEDEDSNKVMFEVKDDDTSKAYVYGKQLALETRSSKNFTSTGQGWLPILVTEGASNKNLNYARIIIQSSTSSRHAQAEFIILKNYQDSEIIQIAGNTHSGYEFSDIRTLRKLTDDTYGGCIVELYTQVPATITVIKEDIPSDLDHAGYANFNFADSNTSTVGWVEEKKLSRVYNTSLQASND